MQTVLTHDVLDAGGPLAVFPDAPAFITSGQQTSFAVSDRGDLRWVRMMLGLRASIIDGGRLISHAREEKLETVEHWTSMAARRCALPVRGYRWSRDSAWISTGPVWAPCIFHGGRFQPGAADPEDLQAVPVADAASDGTRPVLIEEDGMLRWLFARQWEALDVIRGAGRIALAA